MVRAAGPVAAIALAVAFVASRYRALLGEARGLQKQNERLEGRLKNAKLRLAGGARVDEADVVSALEERLERLRKGLDLVQECERLSAERLTEEAFYKIVLQRSQPVVIEGGAHLAGSLQKWMDVGYLEQRFGQTEHWATHHYSEDYMQVEKDMLDIPMRKPITLQAFLDDMRTVREGHGNHSRLTMEQAELYKSNYETKAEEEYYKQERKKRKVHHMMREVQVPEFARFMGKSIDMVNFWLGSNKGGRPKESILHFDPHDNMLAQLIGEKHFVMVHTLESQRMYPLRMLRKERTAEDRPNLPRRHPNFGFQKVEGEEEEGAMLGRDFKEEEVTDNFSPVRLEAPDKVRFPLFKREQVINCRAKAGDLLFMPAFTWHQVFSWQNESQGVHCAVNFWFRPPEVVMKYHDMLHDILMDGNERATREAKTERF